MKDKATLNFVDASGNIIGSVSIYSPHNNVSAINEISDYETEAFFEEKIQIQEATKYEYQFISSIVNTKIRTAFGCVGLKTSQNPSLFGCGVIDTGNYVGRLELELINEEDYVLSSVSIEVISKKINYRNDLRDIVQSLSNHSVRVLYDICSPTAYKYQLDNKINERNIYQKLIFLKGLLSSKIFTDSIDVVLRRPNEIMLKEGGFRDVRQGFKASKNSMRQLVSSTKRFKVTESHPISKFFPSLPSELLLNSNVISNDTPENQFVKFVLLSFRSCLSDIQKILIGKKGRQYIRLCMDVKILILKLEFYLNDKTLQKVSKMSRIPLTSQVLQRKEGYREILDSWLQFDFAMKISWESISDVFYAGQKNIATLYEYWVYFEFYQILTKHCSFNSDGFNDLFYIGDDQIALKLKQGDKVSLVGTLNHELNKIKVRFDYNRTFPFTNSVDKAGSWSRAMRPDYSLSFWPLDQDEDQAEKLGSITRIHFDAKYRVHSYKEIFSHNHIIVDDETMELDESSATVKSVSYKRDDLIKMHSYKDAIKNSFGAYVLYPGDENFNLKHGDDILPGVGAFVMKPGMDYGFLDSYFESLFSYLIG